MIYNIKKSNTEISINTFGAEVISVKHFGDEKFWQNHDGSWDGHCPMLFPYCGHVLINYGGKIYKSEPHGFAKDREFEVINKADDFIELSLRSDEFTKEFFPFDFVFTVKFQALDNGLKFEYKVYNSGNIDLYFSLGGHESINTECNVSGYSVIFNKSERFENLLNDINGYLIGSHEILGEGKELILKEEYFNNGYSLIFKDLKSDSLKFFDKSGKKICKIDFKGFNVLLFWKEENSAFICIEPWLNIPDGYDNENLSIDKKYGFIKVPPKKNKKISQSIEFYK